MKLQWKSSPLDCLAPALEETQCRELTQELKLPEALPDVGRVLGAWGQSMVRSKQWQSDTVGCSGGVMVWVLYAPEDGSAPRVLDGWVPFQMTWALPEGTPEGSLRLSCALRFADARSVSPRKLMLRLGIALSAEAFCPETAQLWQPEETPEAVELLENTYPMTLSREAGEKAFLLDEAVPIPEGGILPEKIVYFALNPRITDRKVLSGKVVFRGTGNLHLMAMGEDGQLESWDFELPFSQFAELSREHSAEAQADFRLCLTSCEAELMGPGQLRLKCGIAAQYRITDRVPVTLVEDAYSPGRALDIQWESLSLPVILERREELVPVEQALPFETERVVDAAFLPEPVHMEKTGDDLELRFTGTAQVLGYGSDGILQSATARWEHGQRLTCHENTRLNASLPGVSEVTAQGGTVRLTLPVTWTATTREQLPQVAGLELGEETAPGANAPSLILRRAGGEKLWDIAKKTGSTVTAITQASGLEGEPAPNQMLLIPVKG